MSDVQSEKLISFITVVRHEEAQMEEFLRHHDHHVDEIVVVHDGECEDRTLEIARQFTNKIIIAPYEGYADPHRETARLRAIGDWILFADADERFGPGFLTELHKWMDFAEAQGIDGFSLGREEVVINGLISQTVRFLRRDSGYFTDRLHTPVLGLRNVYTLSGVHLRHYSCTDGPGGDPEALMDKKRRYAKAQERLRRKYADQPEILESAGLNIDYGVEFEEG